jgi:hypothetical protein
MFKNCENRPKNCEINSKTLRTFKKWLIGKLGKRNKPRKQIDVNINDDLGRKSVIFGSNLSITLNQFIIKTNIVW